MPATTTYLSLGAFRAADTRRDIEHELGLGDWWLGADGHEPRFRAAWIEQTGELYVMQHAGMPGGGTVEVVAHIPTREAVEATLAGWEDAVGEWGSIAWLFDRIGDGAPARVRAIAGSPAERYARSTVETEVA